MDFITAILAAISAFILIAAAVSLALGYVLYRFVSGMDAKQRALIITGLIMVGILLTLTVIGSEVGVVSILTGIFSQLYAAVLPGGEPEE